MLTHKEILNYHLGSSKKEGFGFEFEIFCLNKKYQRIFFNKDDACELRNIFDYLIKKKGFKILNYGKTIGIEKNGAKFTLEPGSQLEYSARHNKYPSALIEEFKELLVIYKEIEAKFDLKFTDISLFPFGSTCESNILSADRYRVMRRYFNNTGNSGKIMMLDTASLQLTFAFKSVDDLEEKVNRLLFLKPVLLLLSSNSEVHKGRNLGYHSFREIVWKDVDMARCGDPGEGFWSRGRWKLEDYVEKVLDASIMFDVAKKQYKKASQHKFRELMNNVDIDSYIFHNSTIFTDVRIKDYIELRYLDNPTILLVPGIILFVESILNNEKIWKIFKESMPYKFEQVPFVTKKLNHIGDESLELWNKSIAPTLVVLLTQLKQCYAKNLHPHLNAIIDEVSSFSNSMSIKTNPRNVLLKEYTNQFDNNLIKILTYK